MSKLIIILLCVLGVVIVGGVLVWQFWSKENIANWHTYTNKELGFEIKCPWEWEENSRFGGMECYSEEYKKFPGSFTISSGEPSGPCYYGDGTPCAECTDPNSGIAYPKKTINNIEYCVSKTVFEGEYLIDYATDYPEGWYSVDFRMMYADDYKILESAELQTQLQLLEKIISTFKFIK